MDLYYSILIKKQSDKNRIRKNKFERFGPYQPLQYIDLPKLSTFISDYY